MGDPGRDIAFGPIPLHDHVPGREVDDARLLLLWRPAIEDASLLLLVRQPALYNHWLGFGGQLGHSLHDHLAWHW
jgi:hypothetical protein